MGSGLFLNGSLPKRNVTICMSEQGTWNITCFNYTITKYIHSHIANTSIIFVIMHPRFALMPIKSKGWYMSVSDQTFNQLMLKVRQKRCASCISLGIVRFVAALFLCINWFICTYHLMNALRETIVVGNEVDVLETRLSMRCDYRFISISITPFYYNSSLHNWTKIRNHLNGIWGIAY